MRKPAFCICENKDADQLRGYREAVQGLCFRYTDSTIPLLPKISNCTAQFVWYLVGNPEDLFSHNKAHIHNSKLLASLCSLQQSGKYPSWSNIPKAGFFMPRLKWGVYPEETGYI